ncbi:type II toxin-antitoxin system VapC family toxin [Dokdonella sp.]|uniref:type II toxin-antitoxin system VapC family toxin n=1 Tax=Dokdonella sp. TaxID=2291710 RepID=UPI0025C6ADBE|nr:type II toxin-antitoxin system VapC family toxin [Dokdonella sp.]MBX3688568.1 type II toxin-antitoxin system VapC family toxin [Dokdonella sp.]
MKITADTNVLVRAIVGDDAAQARVAQAELARAETIVLTLPTLCELVWVLAQGYKIAPVRIAQTVERLADSANVVLNRPALDAGLSMLRAGGDFADGVIAYEGHWLGAEVFVSFDRKAVKLLQAQSRSARLPG